MKQNSQTLQYIYKGLWFPPKGLAFPTVTFHLNGLFSLRCDSLCLLCQFPEWCTALLYINCVAKLLFVGKSCAYFAIVWYHNPMLCATCIYQCFPLLYHGSSTSTAWMSMEMWVERKTGLGWITFIVQRYMFMSINTTSTTRIDMSHWDHSKVTRWQYRHNSAQCSMTAADFAYCS